MKLFHRHVSRKIFISSTIFFLCMLGLCAAGYSTATNDSHKEQSLRRDLQDHGKPIPAEVLDYRFRNIQTSVTRGGGSSHDACSVSYVLKYPDGASPATFSTDDYAYRANKSLCHHLKQSVGVELPALTLTGTQDTTRLRDELDAISDTEAKATPALWIFLTSGMVFGYICVLYFNSNASHKKKRRN